MSLLTTDIRKERRLSLKDVKLPAKSKESFTPVNKPATREEINYSRIIRKYPQLLEAVELLDLVSPTTGERIRIVSDSETVDKDKLLSISKKVIQGERIYSRAEIVEAIRLATKVSEERAEKGFILMLEAGAFEPIGDSYYLTGSTPF